MNGKKELSVVLSAALATGMIPAVAFAEMPDEPLGGGASLKR